MKYKKGDKVKVVKKVFWWANDMIGWTLNMDITIGHTFEILAVREYEKDYQLETIGFKNINRNFWYTEESLQAPVGTQLTFDWFDENE